MNVHHIVLLKFKPDAPRADDLFAALGRLRAIIPGMVRYRWGPYSSPEGANQGFTHAFIMTFRDSSARDGYLFHPEHEKVKAQFLPSVENVIAFDFADPEENKS